MAYSIRLLLSSFICTFFATAAYPCINGYDIASNLVNLNVFSWLFANQFHPPCNDFELDGGIGGTGFGGSVNGSGAIGNDIGVGGAGIGLENTPDIPDPNQIVVLPPIDVMGSDNGLVSTDLPTGGAEVTIPSDLSPNITNIIEDHDTSIHDVIPESKSAYEPKFPKVWILDDAGNLVEHQTSIDENIRFFSESISDHGVKVAAWLWLTAVGGFSNPYPESWQPQPQVYNAYGLEYSDAATGFVVIRSALDESIYVFVPDFVVEFTLRLGSVIYQVALGDWSELNWYYEDPKDVRAIDAGLERGKMEYNKIRSHAQ
jgi:hypothetical protein